MYQYLIHDENLVKRMNPERYSVPERHTTSSVKPSSYSKFEVSSITQPLNSSSETGNYLLPACSSAKIFDEFLLDNDKSNSNSISNISVKPLIPIIHSTNLISHAGVIKQQQANSSQLLTNKKNLREFIVSYRTGNERNSKISDKLKEERKDSRKKATDEKITIKVSDDKDGLIQNESEVGFDETLLLNQLILSNANELSPQFSNYTNNDYSRERGQLGFSYFK